MEGAGNEKHDGSMLSSPPRGTPGCRAAGLPTVQPKARRWEELTYLGGSIYLHPPSSLGLDGGPVPLQGPSWLPRVPMQSSYCSRASLIPSPLSVFLYCSFYCAWLGVMGISVQDVASLFPKGERRRGGRPCGAGWRESHRKCVPTTFPQSRVLTLPAINEAVQ